MSSAAGRALSSSRDALCIKPPQSMDTPHIQYIYRLWKRRRHRAAPPPEHNARSLSTKSEFHNKNHDTDKLWKRRQRTMSSTAGCAPASITHMLCSRPPQIPNTNPIQFNLQALEAQAPDHVLNSRPCSVIQHHHVEPAHNAQTTSQSEPHNTTHKAVALAGSGSAGNRVLHGRPRAVIQHHCRHKHIRKA
jgi:hypothetical protein